MSVFYIWLALASLKYKMNLFFIYQLHLLDDINNENEFWGHN